jgi:hypothetical protein
MTRPPAMRRSRPAVGEGKPIDRGVKTLDGYERSPDAIARVERALAPREKKLGPMQPEVAESLNCLALLSACDSAVGAVPSGEGAYGLRRALVPAGTESQVVSLWRVSDSTTRELMRDYLDQLADGDGRAEAVRHAKLRLMRRHAVPIPTTGPRSSRYATGDRSTRGPSVTAGAAVDG